MKYLLALALFMSSLTTANAQQVITISVVDLFVTTASCSMILNGAELPAQMSENDRLMMQAAIGQYELEARHYAKMLIDNHPAWGDFTYDQMLDVIIERWESIPQEAVQEMGEACMLSYELYLDGIHQGKEPAELPEPVLPEGQAI